MSKGTKYIFAPEKVFGNHNIILLSFHKLNTENTVYTKDKIHHGLTTAQINIVVSHKNHYLYLTLVHHLS